MDLPIKSASSPPKVVFVQDALPFQGGAERVLEAALQVFPQAPVYTITYARKAFQGTPIADRPIHTSFIDRLPGAHQRHRLYLPLMPLAIERFDLREFDVIVSFHYAVAHGVLPRPGQLHISYTHTPMRYAWQRYHQFLREKSGWPAPARWALQAYLQAFRQWDAAAASRVDHFVTPSAWMAACVWRAYRRPAEVLYPPVDLDRYAPLTPRGDFYVTVGRLVAHKKIDLAIEAFNRLGLPLLVVGEGPEWGRLRRLAAPNVTLLGWQPQQRVAELLGRARGFIHAGEEDFGIAMVEAQAAGCPVIALGRGGALEIVHPGQTGRFFASQTSASLEAAVRQFEEEISTGSRYDPAWIRASVQRFARARFLDGFARLVAGAWDWFQQDQPGAGPYPLPALDESLALARKDQDGL